MPHRVKEEAGCGSSDSMAALSEDTAACGSIPRVACQVPQCKAALSKLRHYYQRYRICEGHLKAEQVTIDGEACRFCQLCGRFHGLDAFDNNRRSCRERLARHNNRRKQRISEREAGASANKRLMTTAPLTDTASTCVDSGTNYQHSSALLGSCPGDILLDSYPGMHLTDMQMMAYGPAHSNLVYLPMAGAPDALDFSLALDGWGQPLHSSMSSVTANHIASLSQAVHTPPAFQLPLGPSTDVTPLNPFMAASAAAPLPDSRAALLSAARNVNKPPRPSSWPLDNAKSQQPVSLDQPDLQPMLSAVQTGTTPVTARSPGSSANAAPSSPQAMDTSEDAGGALQPAAWLTSGGPSGLCRTSSRPSTLMSFAGAAAQQQLQDMRVLGEAQTLDALWRDIQVGQACARDGAFLVHSSSTIGWD